MADANDVAQIQAMLAPLVGRAAWGCRLGHGSFVTLEFGEPQPATGDVVHGAWHLWVYGCAWRVERGDELLAGSDDDRDAMATAAHALDGLELEDVTVHAPGLDATWRFSGGCCLRLFSMSALQGEHWLVYLPDGQVLSAGPGGAWSLEPAAAGGVP